MTEYQLLQLRFLRLQKEMPHLKHDGHGPTPTRRSVFGLDDDRPLANEGEPAEQQERAEREGRRGW